MLRNRIRRIHIFSLYPDPYQKMGRIRINFIKFISSWYCILLSPDPDPYYFLSGFGSKVRLDPDSYQMIRIRNSAGSHMKLLKQFCLSFVFREDFPEKRVSA